MTEATTEAIIKKYKLKLGRVFKTPETTSHFVFQLNKQGELICCSIEILEDKPSIWIGYPNFWQVSEISPEQDQVEGRLYVSENYQFGYSWFDVQDIIYLSAKQQLLLYGNAM